MENQNLPESTNITQTSNLGQPSRRKATVVTIVAIVIVCVAVLAVIQMYFAKSPESNSNDNATELSELHRDVIVQKSKIAFSEVENKKANTIQNFIDSLGASLPNVITVMGEGLSTASITRLTYQGGATGYQINYTTQGDPNRKLMQFIEAFAKDKATPLTINTSGYVFLIEEKIKNTEIQVLMEKQDNNFISVAIKTIIPPPK